MHQCEHIFRHVAIPIFIGQIAIVVGSIPLKGIMHLVDCAGVAPATVAASSSYKLSGEAGPYFPVTRGLLRQSRTTIGQRSYHRQALPQRGAGRC